MDEHSEFLPPEEIEKRLAAIDKAIDESELDMDMDDSANLIDPDHTGCREIYYDPVVRFRPRNW